MSQTPVIRHSTSISLPKRKKDIRDIDDSPIPTTQTSPRAGSNNVSYFGSNFGFNNSSNTGNIKVVCRVRPPNQRETELGGNVCVSFEDDKTIAVKTSSHYSENGSGALSFTFDRVYDMDAQQEDIYNFTAKPVVESVLEGFNGTVFAYGQTSSGKTYTMMGPDPEDPELAGIIPRMISTVFDYISDTPDHIEFTVKVSIIEIYMERIRDLLNPKKVNLKIREDKGKGIYIEDVTESYVSDEKDVYDFLKYGSSNRATTTTNMNETSSRSHCIFMMTIHQNNLLEMSAKTGKLYLVDLAGSEKVGKTGAVGQVLDEAKEINKSLSALGNVINALTDSKGHQHIPYRDSKLTRILQESLGGNARTSLIINCSPSSYNENETISTLRFGYRAKSIKNTPKINREFTVAQLQILLEKAEKKIAMKDQKISALEAALLDHGILLSTELDHQISETHSPIEKKSISRYGRFHEDGEEGFDALSDKEDENSSKLDLLMSPARLAQARQQDRIKSLEDELKMERLSLNKQSETIKTLKLDLVETNNRIVLMEKENEALITKLATQSLKMQDFDEKLRDKEMKLEILQLLKDILMTENEELKKSRKVFLKDLDEENKEIIRLAQTEGLLSPKIKTDQKDKTGNTSRLLESERKKDTSFSFVDDIVKDMVKDMVQKLNVKNIQVLKDLTCPYLDKLKEGFLVQNELSLRKSRSLAEGNEDLLIKYERVKEELSFERQKNGQIKIDYEKVIKEYENLLKNNIPSFEEWKQGIVGDSFRVEESIDNKDDTLIFKDYAARDAQDKKLTLNLDYIKEKGKAKGKNGESNIDLSTGIDQYLSAPQTPDNGDQKSPLKTQRMINLEKQLHETKELVNQYKNKIESLKNLITTNSHNTQGSKVDESERYENSETFKQQRQNIRQEVLNQVSIKESDQAELSPRSAANAKIVKPIKGGQNKKTGVASQKFFDILKQQYRFNRSFMTGLNEGILQKQKQQTSLTGLTIGPKTPSEKTKGL